MEMYMVLISMAFLIWKVLPDVIVKALAKKKGYTGKASGMDLKSFKEEQYDKLADGIRSHLDMERIYEIMKENVEEK